MRKHNNFAQESLPSQPDHPYVGFKRIVMEPLTARDLTAHFIAVMQSYGEVIPSLERQIDRMVKEGQISEQEVEDITLDLVQRQARDSSRR